MGGELRKDTTAEPDWLQRIDVGAAAGRLAGVIRATPLVDFDALDPRVHLRLKLECLQETGSFKARGAWNQLSQLAPGARERGVVAASSGNHGKALAWAAQRARVPATIVMPGDAYPNKIQACRDFGAEVVLAKDRMHAEVLVAERVAGGQTLVHPYDSERTIAGAGTVGLEIAREWPAAEVVLVPVGGGGLISGITIALRKQFGRAVQVFGVEPQGAPDLSLALEHARPVTLERVTTKVQGLCPPSAGVLNTAICGQHLDGVWTLPDEPIFEAQRELVLRGGWTVEPAGAAGVAAVLARALPERLLQGRDRTDPLRVVAVVSGGNPDPAQLAAISARG